MMLSKSFSVLSGSVISMRSTSHSEGSMVPRARITTHIRAVQGRVASQSRLTEAQWQTRKRQKVSTLLMAVAATSSLPFRFNEPVWRCWLMDDQGVPPIHMAMIATAKVTANWMSRNRITYKTMLAMSCNELFLMVE